MFGLAFCPLGCKSSRCVVGIPGSLGTELEYRAAGGGRMKPVDGPLPFSLSSSSSRGGGSCKAPVVAARPGGSGGVEAGDTSGDVWRLCGMVSLVSNTKNASPPSPSFMA